MTQTTVLGLGAMGAGMAGNLHRAGLLASAWNRSPARAQAAAEQQGFTPATDLAEAVANTQLIITSVSADADLLEMTGKLTPLLQPGQIVIDTSTVSAQAAQQAAEQLAKQGVFFLDGPVSGGKEGAENGNMVMMVGGDADVLAQVMPALQVITSKVIHMGPVGSGQATKAVNQIMCAGINHAVTEALAFGQHQQLPMDKLIEVVGGGAAGNWFLDHRGPSMCANTFEPGFRVALHHKDLKICQAMLAEQHVTLPMVEMTLVHYERLMQAGYGDEDISALFRNKRALFES